MTMKITIPTFIDSRPNNAEKMIVRTTPIPIHVAYAAPIGIPFFIGIERHNILKSKEISTIMSHIRFVIPSE